MHTEKLVIGGDFFTDTSGGERTAMTSRMEALDMGIETLGGCHCCIAFEKHWRGVIIDS